MLPNNNNNARRRRRRARGCCLLLWRSEWLRPFEGLRPAWEWESGLKRTKNAKKHSFLNTSLGGQNGTCRRDSLVVSWAKVKLSSIPDDWCPHMHCTCLGSALNYVQWHSCWITFSYVIQYKIFRVQFLILKIRFRLSFQRLIEWAAYQSCI